MTKEIVKQIKKTKQFIRSFDDYMNYFIFVFPIGFIAIGITIMYSSIMSELDLITLLISILPISIGIALAIFTQRRLNDTITFTTVPISSINDANDIVDVIKKNFKLSKIEVDIELGVITAYTKLTFFSWGEKLTVIIDSKSLLINSRPTGSGQPLTIIKDKHNIKKLKCLLS